MGVCGFSLPPICDGEFFMSPRGGCVWPFKWLNGWVGGLEVVMRAGVYTSALLTDSTVNTCGLLKCPELALFPL